MADAATATTSTASAPPAAEVRAKPAELPAAPAKSGRKLPEARMHLGEAMRNIFVIVPEAGTAFEDLLDPIYWGHVGKKLRPLDILEIHPEDGNYFAELLVRSVETGGRGAKVAPLRFVGLGAIEAAAEEYRIEWKGGHSKHAVVRVRDKAVLQAGFGNKEDAAAWLAVNAKSLA